MVVNITRVVKSAPWVVECHFGFGNINTINDSYKIQLKKFQKYLNIVHNFVMKTLHSMLMLSECRKHDIARGFHLPF